VIGFPAKDLRSPRLIIAALQGFRWRTGEILPMDVDEWSQGRRRHDSKQDRRIRVRL
jgi:hypothetical protein